MGRVCLVPVFLFCLFVDFSVAHVTSFQGTTSSAILSGDASDLMMEVLDKMADMQKSIDKLERSEKVLKESVHTLIGSNARFRLEIEELNMKIKACEVGEVTSDDVAASHSENGNNGNAHQDGDTHAQNQAPNDSDGVVSASKKLRGIRQTSGQQVAFTAYLDHVISNFAPSSDQTIVFNQVLLNEASSYNEKTGIFTAPVSGVYLFSWSATARKLANGHAYDVWVKLMVNNVHQVGAVAESLNDFDDNQGSNTAVVRLEEGDQAWISHYSSYPDLHGDDRERTTSFTGVLLYGDELSPIGLGR